MTNFLTKSIPNTHLALGIKNLSLWLEKSRNKHLHGQQLKYNSEVCCH